MVRAGTYLDLKMTFLRGAFHVPGELTRIEGEPRPREDMVRVGMGTADIRYRGEFDPWAVDLNVKFNQEKAISYSYEAELGTLDYALANPALASKVIAVADWHINSFESNLFEYGRGFTGDMIKSDNPFSASDHDPIIVDLKLKEESNGGGGAMGALLLALLPLAWRRRRN